MDLKNQNDLSQSRTFLVELSRDNLTLQGVRLDDSNTQSPALDANLKTALAPGAILDGKYKIQKMLGQGGMGVVMQAEQLNLHRTVALKTFSHQKIDHDSSQRFQREVQAIARLRHPNIVQVFDSGAWGEKRVPYYTMEILAGQSLAERIQEIGPLSPAETLAVFCEVCRGLAQAHKSGIVHRDLKPDNIFLSRDATGQTSVPKLLDFGIAKLAVTESNRASQSLTNTGHVFGSPLYMSPEQIMSSDIDLRSDIYSLGCTLYCAVTGAPPFVGATAFATMQMHLAANPPSLAKNSNAPKDLNLVLQKMLAKDPDKRYQSAAEVQDALERLQAISQRGPSALAPPVVTNYFGGGSPFVKMACAVAGVALVATILLTIIWKFYTPTASQPQVAKADIVGLKTDIPGRMPMPGIETASQDDGPIGVKNVVDGSYSQHYSDGRRQLHVPEYVGQLRTKVLTDKIQPIDGNALLQDKSTLELTSSSLTYTSTRLLRGFKPDDLQILHLCGGDKIDSRQLENVAYLTGLKQLSLEGATIDETSVKYINQLKQLHKLTFNGCSGTAEAFAQLELLPQLEQITITNPAFKKVLFSKLAKMHGLIDLALKRCDLTDGDLERIATLKQLRALNLDDNRRITARGIEILSRLKNIDDLYLSNIKVQPQILMKLQIGRELRLSWNLYNAEEQKELSEHFGKKIDWQGCPKDF